MKRTPTTPAALLAPVATASGEMILVGRSDISIPADSLLSIATGTDGRRWLSLVQESNDADVDIERLTIHSVDPSSKLMTTDPSSPYAIHQNQDDETTHDDHTEGQDE